MIDNWQHGFSDRGAILSVPLEYLGVDHEGQTAHPVPMQCGSLVLPFLTPYPTLRRYVWPGF